MTVTSPTTRTRARGGRARLHSALRRILPGAVATALLLGACGAGALSAAAADDDKTAFEIFVSAGDGGMVTPGADTEAQVIVRNTGETAISSGAAALELGRTPLADAEALDAWLEDGTSQAEFARVSGNVTGSPDPDSSATTRMTIPQEATADLAPGIYPLRGVLRGVQAEGSTDVEPEITSATVLIVASGPAPQAAVLVPITATPESGALLTAEELTALTEPDGALSAQLDGVAGTSAILAVDPAIPAAIRVLGASAPPQAVAWLDRLAELPNERFALLFADADAATQAHAALPALLPTGSLASYLDAADFPTASGAPSPTPSPSDTPTPQLPDDAELTAVPEATEGILWPRGDVTDADLATFAAYLGAPVTTVLPSSSTAGNVSGHASRDAHDLLVTDTAASDALSLAAAEDDADARERLVAAAKAHLLLAAQRNPGAQLLVGLDRNDIRSDDALRAAITTAGSPAADLTTLRSAPAHPVTLTAEPETERADALRTMLDDEVTLSAFSSVLDDPALLMVPERIRILRVTGAGIQGDAFTTAYEKHRLATQQTLDAVGIERSSTIQLFGANAELAFWVRNDLPWPVNLRLDARPSDVRLEVQRSTDAQAQPLSNTRVRIPVTARLGSGEVDLNLTLYSPTGVQIGGTERAEVSVRAEWEGIGLIVFGSLAALLIGFGVVRTVRRKRAENSLDASA